MYKAIIYETKENVAHITLNRPDKLNAINGDMIQELNEVLKKIKTDDSIKIVLVKGAGRAFSAGVDLKDSISGVTEGGSPFIKMGIENNTLLESIPQVTIAQVHGYCFTGALELMLCFDMVFCDHDTQIGDTHAKFGIVPSWGMTQRLTRRVGLLKAKQMTFRAMRVKGEEAERLGLVSQSVPIDELEMTVNQVITEILTNDAKTISTIKQLYNDGYAMNQRDGLELEYQVNAKADMSGSAELVAGFTRK